MEKKLTITSKSLSHKFLSILCGLNVQFKVNQGLRLAGPPRVSNLLSFRSSCTTCVRYRKTPGDYKVTDEAAEGLVLRSRRKIRRPSKLLDWRRIWKARIVAHGMCGHPHTSFLFSSFHIFPTIHFILKDDQIQIQHQQNHQSSRKKTISIPSNMLLTLQLLTFTTLCLATPTPQTPAKDNNFSCAISVLQNGYKGCSTERSKFDPLHSLSSPLPFARSTR